MPLFLKNGTVEQPLDEAPFIEAFPNPVRDKLHFRFGDLTKDQFTIRIYNVIGQEVYKEKLNSDISGMEHVITVKHWAQGIYFLETEIGGEAKLIRFLVQ